MPDLPAPEKERFFSRANFHRLGWSLLGALVAFAASSAYSHYRGKERVVIATPDEGAKPLVVTILRAPGDPESQSIARIDELKEELLRLREEQTRSRTRPQSGLTSRRTSAARINQPYVPAFLLPDAVKGYSRSGLSGFGEASCPPDVVAKGEGLLLQLFLEQRVNVEELSPAYLRVDRPEGARNSVRVLEQQYVLATGMNSFKLPIELAPGVYDVSLGFYARAELSRQYPNFYSIECRMTVR